MDLCPAAPGTALILSCDLWDRVRFGCSPFTRDLALPPAQDGALVVKPSMAGPSGNISEWN